VTKTIYQQESVTCVIPINTW